MEKDFHTEANESPMHLDDYPYDLPPFLDVEQQEQQQNPQQQHNQSPQQQPHSSLRSSVSSGELDQLFQQCRSDDWHGVLLQVRENPQIAATTMAMENHITTTVIHQAISSKGPTAVRAQVISTILRQTPYAASIKNGYGSLPLHVISQRNTKMDSQTKESLMFELVQAYPSALTQEGGVGKRTPLHIIFTDYISPRLTRLMIAHGGQACFMKDKKGYLPAHVACSRHCSPEKLRMLLAVNPQALFDKTNDGNTLLDLAEKEATKSHPNYALIEELNRQLAVACTPILEGQELANSSNTATLWQSQEPSIHQHPPQQQDHTPRRSRAKMSDRAIASPVPRTNTRSSRKRKTTSAFEIHGDAQPDADLLLHLSRNGNPAISFRGSIHQESPSLPVPAVTTDEEAFDDEPLSIQYYQQQQQQQQPPSTQVYEI